MIQFLRVNSLSDESGQSLIEVSLICFFVVIALVFFVALFGQNLVEYYLVITSKL